MKLVPLDRDVVETAKGARYLVPRKRLMPVKNMWGQVRYCWRNVVPMPRWLNWLWARLAR